MATAYTIDAFWARRLGGLTRPSSPLSLPGWSVEPTQNLSFVEPDLFTFGLISASLTRQSGLLLLQVPSGSPRLRRRYPHRLVRCTWILRRPRPSLETI